MESRECNIGLTTWLRWSKRFTCKTLLGLLFAVACPVCVGSCRINLPPSAFRDRKLFNFWPQSVLCSSELMCRLVSLVIAMMDNWFWLIGGVKIQNRRIIVSRSSLSPVPTRKRCLFNGGHRRHQSKQAGIPMNQNPKHSSLITCCSFWNVRQLSASGLFHWIPHCNYDHYFSPLSRFISGKNKEPQKYDFSACLARSQRQKNPKIQSSAGEDLWEFRHGNVARVWVVGGRLSVWHLYGIFLFSLLLAGRGFYFVEAEKERDHWIIIVIVHWNDKDQYSQVPFNKSTRQNHCLSIEYPPKRNMSTGTTPTILQSTFLGGSAAVFAVNFTHPIELVKSRVQVNNMGVIQTCTDTLKNEGIAAFWKVRENSGVLEFLCPWIGTSKKCSPFAIFLLVLSFSIPFWVGIAMGLL